MNAAIVYLHGFNSSPASFKAAVIQRELARRAPGAVFLAPALPPSPAAASRLLADLARKHPQASLVGSSLGGYYATWLTEQFALRAVLVNPAVRPYELLAGEVGRQKKFHTGEEYDFTAQHVAELRALEVDSITAERYLLLVETGDEVLDYRHAVEKYRGARQLVIEGGDHGCSDFEHYLDTVLAFVGR
ncbi:MAG: esterase [Betaproteobacteria bacterium]|nr:esterase [Betaproteobacteria bacterium]